jgi:hypothetical protein
LFTQAATTPTLPPLWPQLTEGATTPSQCPLCPSPPQLTQGGMRRDGAQGAAAAAQPGRLGAARRRVSPHGGREGHEREGHEREQPSCHTCAYDPRYSIGLDMPYLTVPTSPGCALILSSCLEGQYCLESLESSSLASRLGMLSQPPALIPMYRTSSNLPTVNHPTANPQGAGDVRGLPAPRPAVRRLPHPAGLSFSTGT